MSIGDPSKSYYGVIVGILKFPLKSSQTVLKSRQSGQILPSPYLVTPVKTFRVGVGIIKNIQTKVAKGF